MNALSTPPNIPAAGRPVSLGGGPGELLAAAGPSPQRGRSSRPPDGLWHRLLPDPRRRRPRPLAGLSRIAATARCSSPSTPTSPPAARPRTRRRGAAADVLPHLRPVCVAGRGRHPPPPAADRQRHLPGDRARPDRHRQGGRERRPPLRGSPGLRRRRRLEPRGDAQPRHRPPHPHETDGRAGRGDEGDLDRGRGHLPGPVRNFERIWSWPKPVQRPHPPVLVGGNGPDRARPRAPLRRRLDAEQHRRRPDLPRRAAVPRRPPAGGRRDGAPAKAEELERYERGGGRRAMRWIPSAALGAVEQALERWEQAMAELQGG